MVESISFTVSSPPKPKGRPRMTRRGRAYTPQSTHDAELVIVQAWRDHWGYEYSPDAPMFDGPVSVSIDYYKDRQEITITPVDWDSKMRSDVDNLAKLSNDALQLAGVVANDKQIVEMLVAKF